MNELKCFLYCLIVGVFTIELAFAGAPKSPSEKSPNEKSPKLKLGLRVVLTARHRR